MDFTQKFKIFHYILKKSSAILLVAHSNPDGDTVGSVLALKKYLESVNKKIDIACFDPLPDYLQLLTNDKNVFVHPDLLDLNKYDSVIACDSVERGFQKIKPLLQPKQVTVVIDHHPDITLKADLNIIDPKISSVCEIIYNYLTFTNTFISPTIATFLLLGIMTDTGNLQHSNTSALTMKAASDLILKGASLSKINREVFSNKNISTLKLWGSAFEKARIVDKNKMIFTVLTQKDLEDCKATKEDIGQVASILNTVPGTSFSLVLSQQKNGIIKGSLRSEDYKGIDVSAIAHLLGGGGHRLASGFELQGEILETENGWKVI